MGAWGPALYSDDTTCDVRDTYIAALRAGASDSNATAKTLKRFAATLRDSQVKCLVYFALADTQWRYGRLAGPVKKTALALLDRGGDVEIWRRDAGAATAAVRARHLQTLRARLTKKPPARRGVKVSGPRVKPRHTDAPIGTVFRMPFSRRTFGLIVLVGHHEDDHWIYAIFRALPWIGARMPEAREIQRLAGKPAVICGNDGGDAWTDFNFMAQKFSRNPLTHLVRTDVKIRRKLPFDKWGIISIFSDTDMPAAFVRQVRKAART